MRRKRIWMFLAVAMILATGTFLFTCMRRQTKTSYVNGTLVSAPKTEPAFYYCEPEKNSGGHTEWEKV